MSTSPPFVVDLHAHFPMHVDPESQSFHERLKDKVKEHHESLVERIEFKILEFADKYFNEAKPNGTHAVTVDTLVQGNVGVALSVAYLPFEELALGEPYASPPQDAYYQELHDLLERVETVIAADGRARIVRNYAELTQARADGKVAMIHAVEGGFQVGNTPEGIADHVEKLSKLGAGYVTIAHLLWRRVCTNVPALPFLPDSVYNLLFHQDAHVGLDPRGLVLATEMVRRGILVDLTHMSEQGMRDTFALLDKLDPGKTIPVLATHIACSFGKYAYNLKREFVEKIAERKGVAGVLYCDHYMRDGEGSETTSFEETKVVLKAQIDKLREWGGDDILAIGSDLDGFIKPSMAGLESAANHRDLAQWLVDVYGEPLATKMCNANALRVFEKAWMKPFSIP